MRIQFLALLTVTAIGTMSFANTSRASAHPEKMAWGACYEEYLAEVGKLGHKDQEGHELAAEWLKGCYQRNQHAQQFLDSIQYDEGSST